MNNPAKIIGGLAAAAAMLFAAGASAQEVKHYRFAHDQQLNSGYSIAYDIFSAKLKELSKGTMLVDQYPGAQLGQEPQILQLVRSGDIDFAIVSSANTSTISPQAGVMSLHYLFRSEDHNIKALADPKVFEAIRDMIDDTVQGIHAIGLGTQGFRHMYGKKEVHKVDDLKGYKVRVQATATEDTMFAAYGAQTVHMPFGSVYTSLQTGVVDFGENAVNVYLINKHYEVAPVLSMTEHEANNAILWISDKLWQSLSADQKQWVHDRSQGRQPAGTEARVRPGAVGGDQAARRWASRSSPTSTRPASRKSPIPISTSSPRSSVRTPTRSRP